MNSFIYLSEKENMRNTYHFCLASHDEVICRDESDYIHAFNCFAVAAIETESRALADAEMSNHIHGCAQTDNINELTHIQRYSYSRYFNTKYHRSGRLGERQFFTSELSGVKHITAALTYVMRQGLHHGITNTPFGYPYCSSNVIFADELGKRKPVEMLNDTERYKYLPARKDLPPGYRMDKSGLLLREDIIDTKYVEEIFITPRNFIYFMNRLSDDKWIIEQKEEDPDSEAVGLALIEKPFVKRSISEMLSNEHGHIDASAMSDFELCGWLDKVYVPKYFKGDPSKTIYDIPLNKRQALAGPIMEWFRAKRGTIHCGYLIKSITPSQIKRCFVL